MLPDGDGTNSEHRSFCRHRLQELRSRGDAILRHLNLTNEENPGSVRRQGFHAHRTSYQGHLYLVSSWTSGSADETIQAGRNLQTSSPPLAQILSCYALPASSATSLDESDTSSQVPETSKHFGPSGHKYIRRRELALRPSETTSVVLGQSSSSSHEVVVRFSSPQRALDELNKILPQNVGQTS
eukprot:TRINITY_DN37862_c0_g1_i1.p1 TRINITY_DN37862_c0_g1~~TRINITY_DN37862_c0_g1_i1.p1  ORF type:complete len:184 (+),score=17.09 TRINITY_DN37862_c0_g1_i1:92-643(+)